ncbi:thiamine pyrophosphate-binding protein [Neobacillus kokaensis]|uniref:Thiamine pyrophosphate protein n=1 Tax=Neobacillus kokaensis TaxID=2759023 RepID=A0ABQ3N307_9BACI|nr:thiamine pyrophosphate-dependent enzyme [Neobacillus kokaensis]GHH99335.1 thiamine pyrophosphate protein [Neobacillus kokaensis]
MTSQMTGGQYIVKWMEHVEIDRFYFVPGESYLHVLDALRDSEKIQAITTRHESTASFAAEAYGKLKGKPAVCMATRGPGASNLSIGIQTAFYDQTPMIALIGQVPTTIMHSGAFQEIDFGSFFRPISKEVFSITASHQLPAILNQAYWLSINGRPGPVVITLPTDILGSDITDTLLPKPVSLKYGREENAMAHAILERLEKADKPLIVSALPAMKGEEAQLLTEFAEMVGVPVCGAWRRFSSFPNDHNNFIGSVGLGSPGVTTQSMKEADCIIGFGPSMEDVAVQGGALINQQANITQVAKNIDSGSVRRSGGAAFNGYIASEVAVLYSLVQICKANSAIANKIREKNFTRTLLLRDLFENRFTKEAGNVEKTSLNIVFNKLNEVIENNAIVTSDAGNFSHWLLRYISFKDDRVYLGPVNGAMGYGIASALGAKTCFPARPVWAFAGDGGAMMTIGDLETFKRNNVDAVIVVINNGIYGTIRAHQEKQFPNRPFGTDLGDVDFVKVAEGMGLKAWKIERNEQIDQVLAGAVNEKGPRLIEIIAPIYPISLT